MLDIALEVNDMANKVVINVCRNPAKGYTLYLNDIRIYGMEPLFEPPIISFEVDKELILGALDGKTSYDIKKTNSNTL